MACWRLLFAPFFFSGRPVVMSTFPAPVLGTPLSPTATRVMLLGAGELGKEVVIALQRLGVEVIAVDRYADAPGHQVAHRAHVVSMTDPQALRQVIEQERPHVVVPEIEAIATDLLVALEDEGAVHVTPTARAAHLTMNREGIRRLAAETLGLPTSPYRFVDTEQALREAIDGGIGYPCVIKPVMSSSGKGQSIIRSADDIAAAWRYAQEGGRVGAGRVIVEGFIEFDYEITLLTVRARGADGQIVTQFCEPIGHRQVDGDYVESWQPHPMSPVALQRSREIALAVTGDLGGLGIFGVELFVAGDQVWFSEVSPRPHDTGMVTLISQVQNEFELHARALLGLPVDTRLRQPGASSVIYGGVDARGVAFEGVAQALAEPGTDIRLFGKPESYAKRRMGVGLAVADDVDQARAKAARVSAAPPPVPPHRCGRCRRRSTP
ncbi:phosphoribosylglycinamide formyltransferase 2 [Bordetella pertussis]|nr:phosphoribosylglycinamide formyltransferase 2 [Bordetella pertussis]